MTELYTVYISVAQWWGRSGQTAFKYGAQMNKAWGFCILVFWFVSLLVSVFFKYSVSKIPWETDPEVDVTCCRTTEVCSWDL